MREKSQIDILADYIMNSIPGEPSQNEGAGDTAVRLLKQYRKQIDDLKAKNDQLMAKNAELWRMVGDRTGNS